MTSESRVLVAIRGMLLDDWTVFNLNQKVHDLELKDSHNSLKRYKTRIKLKNAEKQRDWAIDNTTKLLADYFNLSELLARFIIQYKLEKLNYAKYENFEQNIIDYRYQIFIAAKTIAKTIKFLETT